MDNKPEIFNGRSKHIAILRDNIRNRKMYLKFIYEDKEIILTPEVIRDIRKQLEPQIKGIPFGVLIETVEASGLSVKNLVNLFKKGV